MWHHKVNPWNLAEKKFSHDNILDTSKITLAESDCGTKQTAPKKSEISLLKKVS